MGWYVLRTFCGKEERALSILKSIEAFSRFEIKKFSKRNRRITIEVPILQEKKYYNLREY